MEEQNQNTATEKAVRLEPLVRLRYIKKLSIIGKFIYYLRIARFWKDGDTASFLWNLWNPISWLIIALYIIATLLIYGIAGLKELPGLRLSTYWGKHKDERIFF